MQNISLEESLRGITFGIILEDVADECLIETEIGQGWFFGRALQEERVHCSKIIRNINSLVSKMESLSALQERNVISTSAGTGTGFSFPAIENQEEWRYSVVRPGHDPILHTHKVTEALIISDAELTVRHWGSEMGGLLGIVRSRSIPYPVLDELGIAFEPRTIDLTEIKDCINLRGGLDEECFTAIPMALERYVGLGSLPRSDMKTLGYFGVIESLLSHAPQPNDSADSILRQLKRNLALIENRLAAEEKIGLSLGDGTKITTFISKLYSYRSDLAHGNNSTTSRDWLANKLGGGAGLRGDVCIDNFLRRLVRRVLKQALREPQLITDLKG